MSIVVACAASTLTSSREIVLNPPAVTSSLYKPGSTASMRNAPSDVVVSRETFVALLVILTVAPSTTAPDGSVIVPTINPLLDCATAELLKSGSQNPDVMRSAAAYASAFIFLRCLIVSP